MEQADLSPASAHGTRFQNLLLKILAIIFDRLVLNAVGPGLVLNCRIDAEYWEHNTEREFAFWAESKDCDVARSMNFYELQNLAFKSVLLNGDALVAMPMRHTKDFP